MGLEDGRRSKKKDNESVSDIKPAMALCQSFNRGLNMPFVDINDKRYNLFARFEKDKAKSAIDQIKAKLSLVLIEKLRNSEWSHAKKARILKIKVAQYKELMEGKLSDFSLEDLVAFSVRFDVAISANTKKTIGKDGAADTFDVSLKFSSK